MLRWILQDVEVDYPWDGAADPGRLDQHRVGLLEPLVEAALLDSGIVPNRNAIPCDLNGAWYTSGMRLGTSALVTRGLAPAAWTRSPGSFTPS